MPNKWSTLVCNYKLIVVIIMVICYSISNKQKVIVIALLRWSTIYIWSTILISSKIPKHRYCSVFPFLFHCCFPFYFCFILKIITSKPQSRRSLNTDLKYPTNIPYLSSLPSKLHQSLATAGNCRSEPYKIPFHSL